MGGAVRTRNLGHRLLYEPSLGLRYPEGWLDEVEQTVAAGDHEIAIVRVLRDLLEFPDERIEAMRSGPEWSGRVATAPTVTREARAEQEWVYRPGQFDRSVSPSDATTRPGRCPARVHCSRGTATSPTARTLPWSRPSSGTS